MKLIVKRFEEGDKKALAMYDENGEILPNQTSCDIEQKDGNFMVVTVKFVVLNNNDILVKLD